MSRLVQLPGLVKTVSKVARPLPMSYLATIIQESNNHEKKFELEVEFKWRNSSSLFVYCCRRETTIDIVSCWLCTHMQFSLGCIRYGAQVVWCNVGLVPSLQTCTLLLSCCKRTQPGMATLAVCGKWGAA